MKAINLPIDTSGKSAANLVANEVVTTVNRKVRAIIPEYGAFFANSLVVTDLATGKDLKKGQYFATEMYVFPSFECSEEICALILITDETVGQQLSIRYQALGGENSYSTKALQQLIDDAKIGDLPIDFYDIQGRPKKFPVAPHQHAGRDIYGWDYVVNELGKLAQAVNVGSVQSRIDALSVVTTTIAAMLAEADNRMAQTMNAHLTDADPHKQYVTKKDLLERTALVRKPVCTVTPGIVGVAGSVNNIVGSRYYSFYDVAQGAARFQVSRAADFVALLVDRGTGPVTNYIVNENLPPLTRLYARVCYQDVEGVWSEWSDAAAFDTGIAGPSIPLILTPIDGTQDLPVTPAFTSTPFASINTQDSHVSSYWELWTGPNGTGTLVYSTENDSTNKVSWTIPAGKLAYATTYFARVRYRGFNLGLSGWSPSVMIKTKVAPPAAGTVLDTKCEQYDLYRLLADGNGGANWTLIEKNSGVCGYIAPSLPAPTWSSEDNRAVTTRELYFTEYLNGFKVNNGRDNCVSTDWQILHDGAVLLSGTVAGEMLSLTVELGKLVNHNSYSVVARFNGEKLGPSPWSQPLHFTTNWPDWPDAGTVLRNFCQGFDEYQEVANGTGGSYNVLFKANSTACNYVAPPPAGQVLKIYCQGLDKWQTVANGDNTTREVLVEKNAAFCGYVAPPGGGTVLDTYCKGTDKYQTVSNGDGTTREVLVETNSAFCNYVAPPRAGTVMDTYCKGVNKYQLVANGDGTNREVLFEANSTECGYVPPIPAGTMVGDAYCKGYDRYQLVANGDGTNKEVLIETNSKFCGYNPPMPRGYVYRTYCEGVNKYETQADGVGGTMEVMVEANSAYCGYVAPLPAGTPLGDFYCQGFDKYQTQANGNYGTMEVLIETNAAFCGYEAPIIIGAPNLIAPADGFTIGEAEHTNGFTLVGDMFYMVSGADSWMMSNYQIMDSTGYVRFDIMHNATAPWIGYFVSGSIFSNNSDWYFRVRYQGQSYHWSEWSPAIRGHASWNDGPDTHAFLSGLNGSTWYANNYNSQTSAQCQVKLLADGSTGHGLKGNYYGIPARWLQGTNGGDYEYFMGIDNTGDGNAVLGGTQGQWMSLGGGLTLSISDSTGFYSGMTASSDVYMQIRNKYDHNQNVSFVIQMEVQGACFAVGTMLRTPDGDRAVETLVVGDTVTAFSEPTLIDADDANWREWTVDSLSRVNTDARAKVVAARTFVANESVIINGIHTTQSHPYFVFDGEKYRWKDAGEMTMRDSFIDHNRNLVPVRSIQYVTEPQLFVMLNVEDLDTLQVKYGDVYLLSHNLS